MYQNRRNQKYEVGDIDQFSYKYIYSLFFGVKSLDTRYPALVLSVERYLAYTDRRPHNLIF